nr:hypothetical protein Q903MT_gene1049 [Picea sitchensis]
MLKVRRTAYQKREFMLSVYDRMIFIGHLGICRFEPCLPLVWLYQQNP